jgi:membrane protein
MARGTRVVIPGIRGMKLRTFFKKLYEELVDDAVSDSSAQLSFYFLFALFPFMFFLVTLAAYLPLGDAVQSLLVRLQHFLPSSAHELIAEHLKALLGAERPKLLTAGLLTTLWTASRGVDALRKAMNLAYDVKESRPFVRTQVLAILMTVAGALLIVIALATMVVGGRFGVWLAGHIPYGMELKSLVVLLRWPVAAVAITLMLALCYYVLPDVQQEFKFITPGSVIGSAMWLGSTWGFTQYVEHFGKYNVTYGSIGGVVVLMLWLYITGLIVILGGEVNAIIEHASNDGKAKGARVAGEPAPPLEMRPSAASPGAVKREDAARRSWLRLWRRHSQL